jgi:hypothetical protein
MTPVTNQAYVAAVVAMYVDLPDTPLRANAQDRWVARKLNEDGVPLSTIESALLLASLRRRIRPDGLPPLPPIRSLAYFQPVIAELLQQTLPDGYRDYLRLKLRTAANDSPAAVQKNTFLRDR